jgi:hypothetical protein
MEHSAGLQVERALDPGETFRSPPLRELIDFGIGLPHQSAWRVEGTVDVERRLGVLGHRFLLAQILGK